MTMIHILRRLLKSADATAAVETAIFLPIFVIMTLGVTDLGTGMFARMSVNAAAQAGSAYAVINSGAGGSCTNLTSTCLAGIQTAMNQASGNNFFCTPTTNCTVTISGCTDGYPKCIRVTASTTFSPMLSAAYSWATSMPVSSTVTIRIG